MNPLSVSPKRQLEDSAASIRRSAPNLTTPLRCAIQVSSAIEDQASAGTRPILAVEVKTVQDLFSPTAVGAGRQFKDGSVVVSAACRSRAV